MDMRNTSFACRLLRIGVWLKPEDVGIEQIRTRLQDDMSPSGVENPLTVDDIDTINCSTMTGAPGESLAVYIKDVMNTQLLPELSLLHENACPIWDQIVASGTVHMLIAADNHSRPLFSGKSAKVEMGSIKLLLPNGDTSQQAAHLAIPIFMHEGTPSLQTWRATGLCR